MKPTPDPTPVPASSANLVRERQPRFSAVTPPTPFAETFQDRKWMGYLLAFALVGAAISLRQTQVFDSEHPLHILFVVPILVSAYFGGLGPGLLATALSALSIEGFLLLARDSLWDMHPLDLLQWILLIFSGVLLSMMTEVMHQARRRDRETIEKLRTAEERLLASTQETAELNAAINAHAIVAVTDARGKITFVNDKFCKISGYSRDELIGRDHRIINSGRHPKEFFENLWKTIHSGSTWHGEIQNRAKNGECYWVDTTIMPCLDAEGVPRQYVAIRADITERKRGELALRASEQRFRSTLDHLMEGCHLIDRDWISLYANPAGMRLGRITAEKLIGHPLNVSFPGIETTELYARIKECIDGAPPHEMECEFVFVDGARTWFHIIIQPVPEGIFILSADITAQREANLKLRRREEELRVLFDLIPAMIWFKDTQNRMIRANRLAAKEGGHSVEDTEGRHTSEIYPADSERYYAEDLEVIKSGRPKLGIVRHLRDAAGKPRWVHTDKVPYRDAENKVIGIVIMAKDVTERKMAEDALRQSEERLRQIAENINEVFWIFEPADHRVIYVSPAYEKIWGRPGAAVLANPDDWLESIHPEDRDRVREATATVDKTGSYDETYRVVRPDGRVRWVHDRGVPVRDEKGEIHRIVGTAEDITENRQLQSQFFQAQKMEAIGTLAGGIAHDFNNILGGIIGYTELAKLTAGADPKVARYLDAVLQAGRRAADLVRQILAFSRRREQHQAVVQLRHLVAESMQLLRATVPSTIKFDLSLAPDTATIRADLSQLHQVVLNLCTNAAQAMRDRPGRLEIRLENHLVDETEAAGLPPLLPGLHVRLTIADTGQGMTPEVMGRIFEPFFTTKPPGEGTGLGLSVVHGIVRDHDGAIKVWSRPGEGSRFSLYFPAQQEVTTAPPAQSGEPRRGDGERVCFVDDEKLLAELGRNILGSLGYQVTVATGAQEVLTLIRADPGAFDLIVTDLTMPEMTGLELARAAVGIRPGLPIILTTGYAARLTAEQIHAEGITEMLPKPFTVESLGHAVQRALPAKKI